MAYSTKGTRAKITEALITNASETLAAYGAPDELVVRDDDLKGFIVRLRGSGRHVFAVAYGRGRLLTLGTSDRFTAGKARKAAREALAQTSLEGAPTLAVRKANKLTLGAFLDTDYEPWAATHLKTASETLARLRVNFADFLPTRITDLDAFAIERWRTARLKAGLTKATINRDVVALKAALSKAVAWKALKVHPLASVKPYRLDAHSVVRYLRPEEETRLLTALDARDRRRQTERASANAWRRERGYPELPAFSQYTDHLTPLVLLALHTGLRRGELFALRWREIDLTRASLTVRGEQAKSAQTRHVPLNAIAVATLTTWRGPLTPDPATLVFPSADGTPLEDIKSAWLALVKAAALIDFRFHDLRHTFASKLVMAAVDLNTVRELLGHADLKMTLRYAHLAPEMKAAAVAKLAP
jgi:integrase